MWGNVGTRTETGKDMKGRQQAPKGDRREGVGEKERSKYREKDQQREMDEQPKVKDQVKESAKEGESGKAQYQREILLPSQQKYEDKMRMIKNIETNLLSLQLDKKKVQESIRFG